MQHSSHLLMIRPVNFGFNSETAANNYFQSADTSAGIQEKALAEFNGFAETLTKKGIDVTVVDDTPDPYTPDSVFPNNWISFHENGTVCLYPMFAPNRRKERKQQVLDSIAEKFNVRKLIDYARYEEENKFLEGTGSMVLDRVHKIAYACLSPRTDATLVQRFCMDMQYQPVLFNSVDDKGNAVYHTNVMMCVADEYVVICMNSIPDKTEKKSLETSFSKTGKEIIPISFSQMNHFAGNMLQVHNRTGEKFLVMSSQAFRSLTSEQIVCIEKYNPVIHAPIDTIEKNGGGSARCMLAEIFLKPAQP